MIDDSDVKCVLFKSDDEFCPLKEKCFQKV